MGAGQDPLEGQSPHLMSIKNRILWSIALALDGAAIVVMIRAFWVLNHINGLVLTR